MKLFVCITAVNDKQFEKLVLAKPDRLLLSQLLMLKPFWAYLFRQIEKNNNNEN